MFTTEMNTIATYTPAQPHGRVRLAPQPTPILAAFIESIRHYKEERANATPTAHDLAPIIRIARDNRTLDTFEAPRVDKELALSAARDAFNGLEADTVLFVLDSHLAPVTPELAAGYEPGSLQRQCDQENACERGMMTDLLVFYRVTRHLYPPGRNHAEEFEPRIEIEVSTVPYTFHEPPTPDAPFVPLKWASSISAEFIEQAAAQIPNESHNAEEDEEDNDEVQFGGYITDNLFAAAAQPTILDVLTTQITLPADEPQRSAIIASLTARITGVTRAALTECGFKAFTTATDAASTNDETDACQSN